MVSFTPENPKSGEIFEESWRFLLAHGATRGYSSGRASAYWDEKLPEVGGKICGQSILDDWWRNHLRNQSS